MPFDNVTMRETIVEVPVRRLLSEEQRTLLRAADILEWFGWCKGAAVDHKGRHCILGGIQAATRNAVELHMAVGLLQKYMHQKDPNFRPDHNWNGLTYWNDYQAGSIEKVTDLLRGAANAPI